MKLKTLDKNCSLRQSLGLFVYFACNRWIQRLELSVNVMMIGMTVWKRDVHRNSKKAMECHAESCGWRTKEPVVKVRDMDKKDHFETES